MHTRKSACVLSSRRCLAQLSEVVVEVRFGQACRCWRARDRRRGYRDEPEDDVLLQSGPGRRRWDGYIVVVLVGGYEQLLEVVQGERDVVRESV